MSRRKRGARGALPPMRESQPSTPDLAMLDAGWDEGGDQGDVAPDVAEGSSPEPGRALTRKDKARKKAEAAKEREKERAEALAKKQKPKQKKRGKPRPDGEPAAPDDDSSDAELAEALVASGAVSRRSASRSRSGPARMRWGWQQGTIVALVLLILGALGFSYLNGRH